MKFYETDQSKKDIQAIIDITFLNIQKNFPDFKSVTKNEVEIIIKNYIPIADRLRQHYIDGSEEKTKLLSDMFITAIYMIMNNISTKQELEKSKKSVWIRDKIWVTLSEMKKSMALKQEWNKYFDPYIYQESLDPEIKQIIDENKSAGVEIKQGSTFSPLIIGAIAIGAILVFMKGKK